MICRGENGTNRSHLAVFSEDVAFAHHFVASRPHPPSYSMGVLMVLVMPVKSYLKWQATQLAIQCTTDKVNYLE